MNDETIKRLQLQEVSSDILLKTNLFSAIIATMEEETHCNSCGEPIRLGQPYMKAYGYKGVYNRCNSCAERVEKELWTTD